MIKISFTWGLNEGESFEIVQTAALKNDESASNRIIFEGEARTCRGSHHPESRYTGEFATNVTDVGLIELYREKVII